MKYIYYIKRTARCGSLFLSSYPRRAYNELSDTVSQTDKKTKGGYALKKTLITMTSITYAMKAKKLLNGLGIFCEIEKTPKNAGSGCGYSLRVKDPPERITAQLDRLNIPYKSVIQI